MARDEFTARDRQVLAERSAFICNNPECRRTTIGPHSNPNRSSSVGVAAHICGAASGGPRYDPEQTPEQRADPSNGIWLCHNCSDSVDKDPARFTAVALRTWKQQHDLYLATQNSKRRPAAVRVSGGHLTLRARNIVSTGDGVVSTGGSSDIEADRISAETPLDISGGDHDICIEKLEAGHIARNGT